MKTIFVTLRIFILFTILTGILYPLFITGIAQVCFPFKANGSILYKNNRAVGSELLGQAFDREAYFQSRPSAVSCNPLPSGASNEALTSSRLNRAIIKRKEEFLSFNHLNRNTGIPSEMVFASGSGLDPHTSPKAAILQVERIARYRRMLPAQREKLMVLINKMTEEPQFMCLGEDRINVLLLNLKLDLLNERK
jgi:potassium-transporting ATPase KdpC subunit